MGRVLLLLLLLAGPSRGKGKGSGNSRARGGNWGGGLGCSLTLMLAPHRITASFIVNACQELKILERELLRFDIQFVAQLPLRRPLDAHHGRLERTPRLRRHAQGVRAACVRPHVREGDFFRCALLE